MEGGNEVISTMSYQLISSELEANKILSIILQDKGCILGVDVEAAVEMSRFGILCLLQIAYKEVAYIFDMLEIDHKLTLLKDVFEDAAILKIFHDCTEDSSIICNLYKLKLKNIFDTQIAHRLCFEDLEGSSLNTRHTNISLNDLMKEYLKVDHSLKHEMHQLMSLDPYFWKKRPLTDQMLKYIALDVLYLPKIYNIFDTNLKQGVYKNLSLERIQSECQNYLDYVNINLMIKNFNKISIAKDKVVEGLLKNFTKNCVFVQLNIGYNGIITKFKTVSLLMTKYKVGEILMFKIVKLDQEKKRYILDFVEKNLPVSNEERLVSCNTIEASALESVSYIKKSLNINVKAYFPSSFKNRLIEENVISPSLNLNKPLMANKTTTPVTSDSIYVTCKSTIKSPSEAKAKI